ncbi:MAG: hypothetical protein RJA49_344 [Actinomycetota bacterium]
MNFFSLTSVAVTLLLVLLLGGSAAFGIAVGRRRRTQPDAEPRPVGVVQGALLGLVGLLLAFGLSMAVGRYETRRALVVQEANDIGTTYLRAQLLAEPERSDSLALLRHYSDSAIAMAESVPDTPRYRVAVADIERIQNDLWTQAGKAVAADSLGTAPRLYIETLNDTIDTHTERTASLSNRVPTPVMVLQILGSMLALGALSMYVTMLGRGVTTSLVTMSILLIILFVSIDLDRPHRGFITVPSTALHDVRDSMDGPPAAAAPQG